jgi:hypothetical protein
VNEAVDYSVVINGEAFVSASRLADLQDRFNQLQGAAASAWASWAAKSPPTVVRRDMERLKDVIRDG